MKKFIGVAILLFTLVIVVIYRQLSHRQVKETPEQAHAALYLRQGELISCLLLP